MEDRILLENHVRDDKYFYILDRLIIEHMPVGFIQNMVV